MTTHPPCPAALIVNGDHYPCDWPTAIAAEVEEVIAARVAAVVAAVEAVCDELEHLADGNESARGHGTKVAGYYRRCAFKVRAALKEETTHA